MGGWSVVSVLPRVGFMGPASTFWHTGRSAGLLDERPPTMPAMSSVRG